MTTNIQLADSLDAIADAAYLDGYTNDHQNPGGTNTPYYVIRVRAAALETLKTSAERLRSTLTHSPQDHE